VECNEEVDQIVALRLFQPRSPVGVEEREILCLAQVLQHQQTFIGVDVQQLWQVIRDRLARLDFSIKARLH